MGPEETFWVGVSYIAKGKRKVHYRMDHEGAEGRVDL
jgi:hypothetical protein